MTDTLENRINKKGDEIIKKVQTKLISAIKKYESQINKTHNIIKALTPLGDAGMGYVIYNGIAKSHPPEVIFGATYLIGRVVEEYLNRK